MRPLKKCMIVTVSDQWLPISPDLKNLKILQQNTGFEQSLGARLVSFEEPQGTLVHEHFAKQPQRSK